MLYFDNGSERALSDNKESDMLFVIVSCNKDQLFYGMLQQRSGEGA